MAVTHPHVAHPHKEQLIAFGQGALAADELSQIEQHLEVCRECCETLLDLKDDTFIGLLRVAKSHAEDRRMGTLARPSETSSKTESDETGTGRSAHPTDSQHAATLLVQSSEPVSVDELPAELREHPRYRIVELIGRGGMGNVYRAEHRLMNREVALKLINSQLIRHPQAIERFRREVQAAAKLTHPNIVTAYDAEQAGDVHFLVMEFVEGTDLASVVKHRGAMSVAEACECIRQAAVGLQHAHEKGMVHRDIKPHNLMLSAEGQVRILDFGLAGFVTESAIEGSHVRQNVGDTHVAPQSGDSGYDSPPSGDGGYEVTAAHLTMAGSVMGTPDYIAPEQAKDAHSADIRADIYSLGCTLHFLLTGNPPFVSDSLIAKLKAHAELAPESLAKLRGDVPQELSNVVARMMAKTPAERFQTPAAVAEALTPFAKPAAPPPRRRMRTRVAALCMGVVALLAGVIFVQTDKGRIEIQSEVDDVEVVVKQGGKQIEVIDTTTGSRVRWFPSGKYDIELKEDRNDIEIKGGGFTLTRWDKVVVTLKHKMDGNNLNASRMSDAPVKDIAEIRRFEGHEGPVRAIAWTPDGKAMLSGSGFPDGDKTLRVWDSATGREIRQLTGHQSQVSAIDINRAGDRVIAACEKSIHVWDLTTGKYLRDLRGHSADVTTVIFLPDGRRALSASHDKTVKLWDLDSGTEQREFTGHTGATFGLAMLPGHRQFLSGSWDGTIRLWNLETGESLRTFTGHSTWCVKMLPDGLRFLSAGDDGTVRLWEISSGKQLRRIRAHERQVFALDVSPDGQLVATGGNGRVSLWNVETGEQLARASHREFVWSVAFAPDGKSLLSAGGGEWKSENWQNGDDWVIRLWRRPEQPKTDWNGWSKDAPPSAIAPFDTDQAKAHQAAWAKYLGVPVEYTNSIGMKFVLIPPGEFTMGSAPEVIEESVKFFREANNEYTADAVLGARSEGPQHKVILTQPRYLAVHEVTQSQYEKVMGKNPSHFAAAGAGKDVVAGVDTANHPVEMTSWIDAAEFCAKLSQKEALKPAYFRSGQSVTMLNGNGYRLPTEAEWEFSCRAGATTSWRIGDKAETIVEKAWIVDNSGNRTHAVGELRSNPFGLCDIHGNVLEWCQDKWELTYYGQFQDQPAFDPQNTSNELPNRVARGGSWKGWPYNCSAPLRWHLNPMTSYDEVGFRVSLGIDAVRKTIEKPVVKSAILPKEANLITDPSFENTGLTLLPRDWRAWTNEDSDFRCEVVNGGHTGQRSLRISGKGIRGVVFGNDLKVDRSKRYALKGWAKFEGDKDARAIIKFNYFRGSEFLGVHDLVGVTADQPGWHMLEKTDALDVYPQADHFYAMCHVEGSGSGWFDDLELITYDRDKLPADFDARHGRHNRLTGPNSLDRWVGAWETEYVFRETDNSPNETKLKMTTASERTLGDYFLLSHAKRVQQASRVASAPGPDTENVGGLTPPRSPGINGEERLLFLTFDQNLGAFRQWFFSSNGKAFEWRGPWDDATKSLELRMLPDASNLFSSERFVDADHIEAKLRFQYVMGMKDAGCWTTTRKAATAKVDVPTLKAPAAEPAELALLDKLAGEWAIHGKSKPSVWRPEAAEERFTEQISWILGGKFLMARAFNDKGQLTSIWIATYEPLEKSNHAWFFNADGSSGQWRVTWDAASRSFHWRSIDMPTGWTGTALNRLIDDDTFDNQVLIKDETGRVMLDATQHKRRKK